ncbi:HK97 family phage prohead protease [Clostridium sp.]|uniref:HK97 family phage prohead protease n=1 Tax=Clostridium sp. TaxID=1506 RepID=UPI00261B1174|nr:HK97 family phage prohead protease [Clostridium sp.]
MEKIYNKLEVRELENNSISLVCKVNDYGLSKELRGINGVFKEIVPRDTWERAINENIKFYYNHKPYFELADKVELRAEEDGVYLYATLKESEKGLYDAVKNGEITGMSFGFKALKDRWENIGNYKQRIIEEMELFEVSILDKTPAYNNTSVEARELNIPVDLEIKRRRLELLKL